MHALEIKDLRKTYNKGTEAVKGINLTIEKGDFFGLLGPNGAGKSTTIGMITDIVTKTSGKIIIFGKDFDTQKDEAKALIGVVPQESNLEFFGYLFDILVYAAGFYGVPRSVAKERAEFYLKKLDLWEKRKAPIHALSGGMKRKAMLIRAVMHDPELIIFDEPTAGLDVESRRNVWEFMKELNKKGKTIILTTHYLEEAEQLCKNIAIIHKGTILKNTTVKKLISEMEQETFILDIAQGAKTNPLAGKYESTLVTPHTIEVTLPREKSMNEVFTQLTNKKVKVMSMRNKTNRLEELFVKITK
jgi:ABC-2 type transport system ATP-binding protein